MMPPVNLLPYHGGVILHSDFLPKNESDDLFAHLLTAVEWKQQPVKIFGNEVLQPRLTASFADAGISYGYSGLKLDSRSWSPVMKGLKKKVQEKAGQEFNTALLNLYRDGNDYMGWHRDNEAPLGKNPLIASVSLGAIRLFQLREQATKSNLISIELSHGSLLLMGGESQHHWQHRLPKNTKIFSPRVNITFRMVR